MSKPPPNTLEEAVRRIAELETLINRPDILDFIAGVQTEAAHQVERHGLDHDAVKTPFDWFWTLGYLSQKAAAAAAAGDIEKARHHTISSAALLANWHAHLMAEPRSKRASFADFKVDPETAAKSVSAAV